jgi:hypothetical protein
MYRVRDEAPNLKTADVIICFLVRTTENLRGR